MPCVIVSQTLYLDSLLGKKRTEDEEKGGNGKRGIVRIKERECILFVWKESDHIN